MDAVTLRDAMVWAAGEIDQSGSQHLRLRRDDNRRFLVAAMSTTPRNQKISIRQRDGRIGNTLPQHKLINDIRSWPKIAAAHALHVSQHRLEDGRAGRLLCGGRDSHQTE